MIADQVGTGPTFSGAAVAGATLMAVAFLVPGPHNSPPQGLSAAGPRCVTARSAPACGSPRWRGSGWGLDVLVPLRLNSLGASALVIGATFLAAAAIEAGCRR